MTDSKPEFKRQESWRYKRIHSNWRRPRGVTSKMRKEESGWPAKVKVGYRTKVSTRDLHPRGLVERRVWREKDLEGLDPKLHIIRLAHRVGERKRLTILDRAKQLNFHVANPGKEAARPTTVEEPSREEAKPEMVEATTREEPAVSEVPAVEEKPIEEKREETPEKITRPKKSRSKRTKVKAKPELPAREDSE